MSTVVSETRPFDPQQSSYRWVIMALAASAFLMAFMSRFAWPPLMPVAMPDLGITSRSQGLAYMSAFYIGYIITQIPGGVLADRFGPRVILASALGLQGLGTLGLAFIESYQSGFILRIICGLGGGCVYSACLKAITSWFSPTQRGLAIAVLMSAPTVGVALPNFVMPALESSFGWQQSFLAVGLAILAIAALLAIMMKEIKTGGPAGPRKSFVVGLKYVLQNRNVLLISLTGFCGLWAQIGFGSVGNDYLVGTFGVNLKSAGAIMVVYGCIGLASSIGAGWLSARFPDKKKQMVVGLHILMGIFCLMFGQLGSMTGALIGACLIGIMVSAGNPLYAILLADNVSPEWMATASGVSNTIFQVGALLSPLVIGKAYNFGGSYAWAWPILAVVAALGAVFASKISTK